MYSRVGVMYSRAGVMYSRVGVMSSRAGVMCSALGAAVRERAVFPAWGRIGAAFPAEMPAIVGIRGVARSARGGAAAEPPLPVERARCATLRSARAAAHPAGEARPAGWGQRTRNVLRAAGLAALRTPRAPQRADIFALISGLRWMLHAVLSMGHTSPAVAAGPHPRGARCGRARTTRAGCASAASMERDFPWL